MSSPEVQSATRSSSSSGRPRGNSLKRDDSGLLKFRTEYLSNSSHQTTSYEGEMDDLDPSQEPAVLEYVEVRRTDDFISSNGINKTRPAAPQEKSRGHAYIRILSPAVNEALRCVVDYYPSLDLAGKVIKVYEPFAVFVFFEAELTAYRQRLLDDPEPVSDSCVNRYAAKHISVAQDFVKTRTQDAVQKERQRHSRGYCTFDMLWLLYKPGVDIYLDYTMAGEHDPHVLMSMDFDLTNGKTNAYSLKAWNMDANSWSVGPTEVHLPIERFAGEKEIITLLGFPCDFVRFRQGVDEKEAEEIRRHFIDRGKLWYDMRRKQNCYSFDGVTTTFPRREYASFVMVDPMQYPFWNDGSAERATLLPSVAHPSNPLRICSCDRCARVIYQHAVEPRFAGYSHINPLVKPELTEHQYFLCDNAVEAFIFKIRTWKFLHISGFRPASFDNALFERLVLRPETKKLVKSLTEMYVRDKSGPVLPEVKPFSAISTIHKPTKQEASGTTWSADFVKGKGEGLTFLLHGSPGTGKTYTAECIAHWTGRPLLSLTCADIGVNPEVIEGKLLKWFSMAETWGAIMLIDEADIYLEQRAIQDVERNHLVAGFIRALEYFKGILFLTTNRVGTFDEAFVSRIHVQLYYPDFTTDEHDRVWDTFFQKLEDDRETTMRIPQPTKDYTQSEEIRALNWNGREIRNAFQVAVALAEAQAIKDREGRVLIRPEHIKATVTLSKEFRTYLTGVHQENLSKRAKRLGHRNDGYGHNHGVGREDGARTNPEKY